MPCPACGWDNPADSRFCNQCGAPQGAPAALGAASGAPAAGRPAGTALAAPDAPPTSLEAEVRRLARRVEALESRLSAPPAPASLASTSPAPNGSPRPFATLAPRWPRVDDWRPLAARWPRPNVSGRRGQVALVAAVVLLGLLVLLVPILWDAVLPPLRRQLNQMPLPLGIAAAVALLAALAAGAVATAGGRPWAAGAVQTNRRAGAAGAVDTGARTGAAGAAEVNWRGDAAGEVNGAGSAADPEQPDAQSALRADERPALRCAAALCWRPGGVVLALALAAVAEGLLLARHSTAGVVCMLVAGALACWLAARGPTLAVRHPATLARRYEWPLLLGVVAVGAALRLVLIGAFPVGIEGDESHWVVSAVHGPLAGGWSDWQTGLINSFSPWPFIYAKPFFLVLGPTLFTARLMVALMSIVANVVFYCFVRRAFGVPVALLATFLMGVSIADVASGRFAHVEAQVKLWVVLAPFFAAWAVDRLRQRRAPAAAAGAVLASTTTAPAPSMPPPASAPARPDTPSDGGLDGPRPNPPVFQAAAPLLYLLASLALVAGLLTYDTYHPMAAVVGLYLGAACLIGLIRQPRRWPTYVWAGLLFLLPVALVTPRVLGGMNVRRGHYTGIAAAYGLDEGLLDKLHHLAEYLGINLGQLLSSLFVIQHFGDFILNRDGPWLNAALLPLFVVGLAWVLGRAGERHNPLVLLWFGLLFFPAAVLIGAVWFRVIYPAMPVVYLFVAVGLWWIYTALAAVMPRAWQPALAALLVAFLGVVAVFNTHIYFREARDYDDRLHRRELSDLITESVAPGRLVFLAYQPNRADFVAIEEDFSRFVVRGKAGIGNEAAAYRQVPYADLLSNVFEARERYDEIRVVVAGPQANLGAERNDVLVALQRCFPGAVARQGKWMALYTLPPVALANPQCTLDARAQLVAPPAGVLPASGSPLEFVWRVEQGQPRDFRLEVERFNDRVITIEGEQFSGAGWVPDTRFADGFRGTGFLQDEPRAGAAVAQINVPTAGRYDVWVRSLRRAADDTHVYLDFGDGPREFGRALSDQSNPWVWDRLGPIDLPAGPLPLTLTKDYGTARHMAMFVDTVVLSRDPAFEPDGSGPWDTVLDTTVAATGGDTYRVPGPPTDPGRYRWRVQMRDGDRLIDRLGQVGQWTPYQEFTIR